MQKHPLTNRLALILLALALLTAGCKSTGPATSTANNNAQSTDAFGNPLTGGALPNATLPPFTNGEALPTLVPTITLPTAVPPAATLPPTGAQPAPQNSGQPVSAACMVGTWQVADLNQVMADSLAQSGASLTLEAVEGRALYQFNADGELILLYDKLSARMAGQVEGQPVVVTQLLDGSGTARYTLDENTGELVMSGFGGDGIQSRLVVNDQVLAEGSVAVWQALAGQLSGSTAQEVGAALDETRAAVTCSGDSLVIQSLKPVPSPPVRLERVR